MSVFKALLALLFLSGCADKYLVPGNRFITPESQGGFLHSQFEVQNTSGTQYSLISTNGVIDRNLSASTISRTGYMFSTALLEKLDFFWSHTGGSVSLLNLKYQFIGGSRSSKATGHKLAATAGMGGNDNKVDNIDLSLKGQELSLIYGYRFVDWFMMYTSLFNSTYTFSATVPGTTGSGSFVSKVWGLYGGTEISFGSFFGKAEVGYQKISTGVTHDQTNILAGYSFGLSW